MKITIIGTGFVGVVSAGVFASLGHEVIGLDIDQNKIDSLRLGKVPFYEPGLEELLLSAQEKGKLSFTTDYEEAISNSEIIIIAVGTPSRADGNADLKYIFAASQSLASFLKENAIVAIKSTVPPGTLDEVKAKIDPVSKVNYYTASLPEFLREGSAVQDTLHPDRIVIGASDEFVFEKLEELHRAFEAPILKMRPESAQMAKYTANSFLATRITFINEIANLCEKNKADIQEVIEAIGLDKRIGTHYWYPGLGYGGSCFPKDVKELAAYSRSVHESDNLLNKVSQINEERIPRLTKQFASKVGGWKDKTIAVLGLSFKPNTDDTREAPALKIIPLLLDAGAKVQSYDPMAKWSPTEKQSNYQQLDSITKATEEADVIMVLVEWPELINFDYAAVKADKQQWLIDVRNQLLPEKIKQAGYNYLGIGRSNL